MMVGRTVREAKVLAGKSFNLVVPKSARDDDRIGTQTLIPEPTALGGAEIRVTTT